MTNTRPVRFEVPLTPARYGELSALSDQIGVSPRDLARLAIVRLPADRDSVLGVRQIDRGESRGAA